MKITAISPQIKNINRVNVFIDGKYRLSLDIYQIVDLNLKVGQEYSEAELVNLDLESQFGKIYTRALEYCLMRPHSMKEVKDYLYKKTFKKRNKLGELTPGISTEVAEKVFDRLVDNNYLSDTKFAQYWVENRSLVKGVSMRKMKNELRSKGIDDSIIENAINNSERNDSAELEKVIAKKRTRYIDDQKLIMYLVRQGFDYDNIKIALSNLTD